jgi:hypothetical protein
MRSPGVEEQLDGYKGLVRSCRVVLVTPTGSLPYGGG